MIQQYQQVKIVGINGQISIGKDFAGKMVMIDQIDQGTWIIKAGEFIPDSEKWLHQSSNLSKLKKALTWADKNPPIDNFNQLANDIDHEHNKN